MDYHLVKKESVNKSFPFLKGIFITLLIALIAKVLAEIPLLSIMGQLVIAILLGIIWRTFIGVKQDVNAGITFSSKQLLRFGIILLGMRLNFIDIYQAGSSVFLIAVINIVFTLFTVYGLTKWLGVNKKLGILTACGTAICGAAAVVAISSQIRAKDDETAIGAATVAILGTIFTIADTLLYHVLGLSPKGYGVYTGGTLHEIAHVIAAAAPGGSDAVDIAVIVKLTRVALLIPIAIILGLIMKKTEGGNHKEKFSFSSLPIPWFIIGFLGMSTLNTFGVVTQSVAVIIVTTAYLIIGMAMAGLGLNIKIATLKELGMKSFVAGFIGSILLSLLGYVLVFIFHIN